MGQQLGRSQSNLNCMHLMQNCREKKSFRYYLHTETICFKKRRIVCQLQKMPELSLQRQQNVLTANSHRLRSGPCLFLGSLRVSFSKESTSHWKHPEVQKYTRSDPNSCLNILKNNQTQSFTLACHKHLKRCTPPMITAMRLHEKGPV